MSENKDEWVESLRGEHESDKEWVIKKSFLLAHHESYEQDRLLCLANCFINIEMYGCRYPNEVMIEVKELAEQLSELADFRRDKREREANRIKFVQQSGEPKKRQSQEPISAIKSKFPAFVSAGAMTTSVEETPKQDLPERSSNKKSNIDSLKLQSSNDTPPTDLRSKLNRKSRKAETLTVTINHDNSSHRVSSLGVGSSLGGETSVGQGTLRVREIKPALTLDYQPIYQSMEPLIKLDTNAIHKVLILDSPDPVTSLILTWAPNCFSTLSHSLSQANHLLDSRRLPGRFELTIDSVVVAGIKEHKALPLISSLEKGNKTRLKQVASLLMYKLMDYLIPRTWLIIRKDLSGASKAVTNDRMQGAPKDQKQMSKGLSLLKSIGWTEGTGLGSHGQGIKEPVAVETTINRQGLGFGDGTKTLKKCAGEFFRSYVQEGRSDMMVFSSEFTAEDRKILHQLAQSCGLKSHSRGKGNSRCLTVTRKGVTLGAQLQDLVQAGIYDCDWCTIIPPGTEILWEQGDNM